MDHVTMPELSIVMSTYCRNHSAGPCDNLLKRAIDSVLNQSFKDFEFIIIDDGSVDESQKVIEEYCEKDKRIIYKRFNENSGIPAKRYNDGIEMARGHYVMFQFDDDFLYPKAAEKLLFYIKGKYKDHGMVYGLTNYMNVKTGSPLALNFGDEWSLEKIKKHNFLCNNSVIVKSEVFNKVGGYDEDTVLRRLCDWELWWRIGELYKVSRVPVLTGEVNAFHEDSIGVIHEYDMNEIRKHINNPERKLRLKEKSKKKI